MAEVMGCGVHVPAALRCADMYGNAAGNQLEMRGTLRYRTGAERHTLLLAACGPCAAVALPMPKYYAVRLILPRNCKMFCHAFVDVSIGWRTRTHAARLERQKEDTAAFNTLHKSVLRVPAVYSVTSCKHETEQATS